MDLKEDHILGDAVNSHWYYRAKAAAIQSLLEGKPARLLIDVDAGSGVFSCKLLDAGLVERSICVDPCYELEGDEHYNGRKLSFCRQLVEGPYLDS